MQRLKALFGRLWREYVVDDFDKHYPNDPSLF